MTETAARSGREPRSESQAPFSKSESQIRRLRHIKRATPTWSWPPARLTDRLFDPDMACPSCGRAAPPNRSWCEHCGSVQP